MKPQDGVKRVTILGATGSIGQSTIDVIRQHPGRFAVEALVANSNVDQLADDARVLGAKLAVTAADDRFEELKGRLAGSGVEVAAGANAVNEAATRPCDLVMAAIVGAEGLTPTLKAVEQGRTVCLANKECLVSAGELFMARARVAQSVIIPVDSEHSAIAQCLETHNAASIKSITLTASGGPFRTTPHQDFKTIRPEDALKHPNWSMGRKITIDSATLMNKGLELIEAFHLFPVDVEQLGAVVHPQSIVHSFVSYEDGSVLAQLGVPDMKTPIAWAMAHPHRISTDVQPLDLAAVGQLTFEAVDTQRFPAIGLCLDALKRGGNATTILNAANEVAVAEFLSQRIGFLDIPALVEESLSQAQKESCLGPLTTLDDVWEADQYGRETASRLACDLQ
jgi:1-deoxy-D-xylulose-5-phosphate reductoisomerase